MSGNNQPKTLVGSHEDNITVNMNFVDGELTSSTNPGNFFSFTSSGDIYSISGAKNIGVFGDSITATMNLTNLQILNLNIQQKYQCHLRTQDQLVIFMVIMLLKKQLFLSEQDQKLIIKLKFF